MKLQLLATQLLIMLFIGCGNPHLLTNSTGTNGSINPELEPPTIETPTPTSTPTATPSLDIVILDNDQEISNYDFGKFAKNEQPSKTLTVFNKGTVVGVSTTPAQSNDNDFVFVDSNACLTVVEPGAKCNFVVTFKSKKLGFRNTNLKFSYINQNFKLEAQKNLDLTGIKIKANPKDVLKLSWSFNDEKVANFGKSRVEDSTVIYVTIKNEDTVDAYLQEQSFPSEYFTILDNACLDKIEVGSFCTFKVKFETDIAGLHERSFGLNYSDDSGDLFVALETVFRGEKVAGSAAPIITISEFDSHGLDFGEVSLGNKYDKLLEVTNTNNQDLVVSLDEIFLQGSADFNFTGGKFPGTRGTCKRLVAAGRCLIEFTFIPTSLGKQHNLLTLRSTSQKILKTELLGTGIENSQKPCQHKSDYLFFSEGKFNPKHSSIVYPYLTSVPTSKQKLSLLYGLETNKRYNCSNCEAVQDAMVLSRYNNINWPESDFLHANIQVHVGKVHHSRKWLYTEMLCIQNTMDKICSGELFNKEKEQSWYALLNKNFFNTRPGPVNLEFNNMLFKDERHISRTTAEGIKIDQAMIMNTLSLARIYDISPDKVENILRAGFLNVILVDDIKNISFPRLQVTSKKDIVCENIIQ